MFWSEKMYKYVWFKLWMWLLFLQACLVSSLGPTNNQQPYFQSYFYNGLKY